MANSTLEIALSYASWGWKVLPVVPNGKIPATAHGVKDATDDPEKIKQWWTNHPDMNIGIAAGSASGIIVYDIDPRNGGDNSWEVWLNNNGAVPDGVMALTAGGGQHYIAQYQEGIRSCKLREGIDLLSDGRYFVAYPSKIEGRSYQWEASSDPFDGIKPFVIPANWLASMSPAKAEKTVNGDAGLIRGNRNDGLTSLAGAMRSFGMSASEIFAAINVANETRCEIPLPTSEIRQIVNSVSRYAPDKDVAAESAIGSEAAESLIDNITNKESNDYYLTRATSFLSQPAPMPWVIKGWIPAMSTVMMYGESGVGKSFVALDMACSIASGMDWQGIKTNPGVVIYLAGEGNYGIRQRVASWCKKHGIENLDNLLISNKPIDLDSQGSALKVISAVRDLTHDNVSMIFVDTLNNHMSGDENSAKDTRAMINSCMIAAMALDATTAFVHHTGLSDTSKSRARGSSAWKGSLDSSILITRASDKDVIKISCTKMKDTAEPNDLFGALESIELGWVDEDGEPINGAAFMLDNTYQEIDKAPKDSKASGYWKIFANAWVHSGSEKNENGNPIISRSALAEYLEMNGIYKSEGSIKNNLKGSYPNGFIFTLVSSEIIKANLSNNGNTKEFEVVNEIYISELNLM